MAENHQSMAAKKLSQAQDLSIWEERKVKDNKKRSKDLHLFYGLLERG